jgi:hypothetical protein
MHPHAGDRYREPLGQSRLMDDLFENSKTCLDPRISNHARYKVRLLTIIGTHGAVGLGACNIFSIRRPLRETSPALNTVTHGTHCASTALYLGP